MAHTLLSLRNLTKEFSLQFQITSNRARHAFLILISFCQFRRSVANNFSTDDDNSNLITANGLSPLNYEIMTDSMACFDKAFQKLGVRPRDCDTYKPKRDGNHKNASKIVMAAVINPRRALLHPLQGLFLSQTTSNNSRSMSDGLCAAGLNLLLG